MTSRLAYSRSFWITVALIGSLSLWIRMAFPIAGNGWAAYDDLLFVRQAAEIGMGHWLGSYNNLTHAKGIGYSVFMLLNHAIGLPLKFSEQAMYLLVVAFFAITIGQLYRSRAVAFVTFVLLAFIPTPWSGGVGGRVVREGIYLSQALMLVTLGVRCWVLPADSSARALLHTQWKTLCVLGLVAGWFWLTREEGVWLLPAMLILLCYWLVRQRNWLTQWRSIVSVLVLPVLAMSLVIGMVNAANYAVYGVFRNNDFRSSDYQAGYGALMRIRHDNWQRYVLFPKDARERAYEMSAAARELRPYFEGQGGQDWLRAGCEQTGTSPCPEILSGWFMWALRGAVASAGHYSSAKDARAFYRRLAREIDEGCRAHPGDCFPQRATLLPPWHEGYMTDTVEASWAVFKTLVTLGNLSADVVPSQGDPKHLALFDVVTNGPLAPTKDDPKAWDGHALKSPRDIFREGLAQHISGWMNKLSTYGLPLAFVVWAVLTIVVLWRWGRRHVLPPSTWWLATAFAAAVTTRVVLLGFLEATSIPSNNMLYLFPLVPFSLGMIPIVLWSASSIFSSPRQ
ncbi:glycosyltransferase family protein [Comamonas humi]